MFRSSRARRLVAIAALLAIVVSTLALAVTAAVDAAPAHGDEGTMTITKAEATSPTSIRVEAGLVYANDDELATGATVTATATGPGGATAGPVPLSRLDEDSSVYGGDLTVPQPGSWQVQRDLDRAGGGGVVHRHGGPGHHDDRTAGEHEHHRRRPVHDGGPSKRPRPPPPRRPRTTTTMTATPASSRSWSRPSS